jgi:hypothetical protein
MSFLHLYSTCINVITRQNLGNHILTNKKRVQVIMYILKAVLDFNRNKISKLG